MFLSLCNAFYSYTIIKATANIEKFRAHTHTHTFPHLLDGGFSGWEDLAESKGGGAGSALLPTSSPSPLNVLRGMSGPTTLIGESASKGDLCPTLCHRTPQVHSWAGQVGGEPEAVQVAEEKSKTSPRCSGLRFDGIPLLKSYCPGRWC